jgi:hypothetical protein
MHAYLFAEIKRTHAARRHSMREVAGGTLASLSL